MSTYVFEPCGRGYRSTECASCYKGAETFYNVYDECQVSTRRCLSEDRALLSMDKCTLGTVGAGSAELKTATVLCIEEKYNQLNHVIQSVAVWFLQKIL